MSTNKRKKTIQVAVDLGGSNTRLKASDSTAVVEPSNFKKITVDKPISDKTKPEDILDIAYVLPNLNNKEMVTRIVIGESAKLYTESQTQMYNDKQKTKDDTVLINLAKGLFKVVEEEGLIEDYGRFSIKKLAVALPPNEVYGLNGPEFKSKMKSAKIIVRRPLLLKSEEYMFEIKEVETYIEGKAAIEALPDDIKEKLKTSTTLVIDGGRRSIDMILLKNGEVYNGGYETVKTLCGMVLLSMVSDELEKEFDMEIPEDDILDVVRTGYYHNTKDVSATLESVKIKFVDLLYAKMNNFINKCQMDMKNIDNILFLGRVFADGEMIVTDKKNPPRTFLQMIKDKVKTQGNNMSEILIHSSELENVNGVYKMMNSAGETLEKFIPQPQIALNLDALKSINLDDEEDDEGEDGSDE